MRESLSTRLYEKVVGVKAAVITHSSTREQVVGVKAMKRLGDRSAWHVLLSEYVLYSALLNSIHFKQP